MSNRGRIWGTIVLCAATACGPSASELRARRDAQTLRTALAEQRQYVADLKQRMQMVEARNRVLIDLVQGVTSNAPATSNVKSESAQASLEALDRDLQALVASVLHSREDVGALQAQRKALADELAQAKQTIEASRADEERTAARVSALRDLLT